MTENLNIIKYLHLKRLKMYRNFSQAKIISNKLNRVDKILGARQDERSFNATPRYTSYFKPQSKHFVSMATADTDMSLSDAIRNSMKRED